MKIKVWFGQRMEALDHVTSVYAPSVSGMIGILPDHCSMVSVLSPGVLTVSDASNIREYPISGGVLVVHDDMLTVWTAASVPVVSSHP